jgi:hypothetical protein
VEKVEKMEGKQSVYNITVKKHHAYLANGILVSNCDCMMVLARSVSMMPVPTTPTQKSYGFNIKQGGYGKRIF